MVANNSVLNTGVASKVKTDTHLTASFFPGQPRQAGTRKVKPFWILMEQEMMGWQWHQLDICKSTAPHSRENTTLASHHSIFYRLSLIHI